MSYRLEFTIPGLTKTPNQLLGAHWRTRSGHKKKWAKTVEKAIQLQWPKKPLKRAKLTCIRSSSSEPDHDGLSGSFKAILDSLVQLGVLENDTPSVIGIPDYRWERGKPGQGFIRVIVEEIPLSPVAADPGELRDELQDQGKEADRPTSGGKRRASRRARADRPDQSPTS